MRPERDAELENAVFENESFRGHDLSGLRTTGCTFRECDFTLAQLNGSEHAGSDFANSTFESANLFGASFAECRLVGAVEEPGRDGAQDSLARFDAARAGPLDDPGIALLQRVRRVERDRDGPLRVGDAERSAGTRELPVADEVDLVVVVRRQLWKTDGAERHRPVAGMAVPDLEARLRVGHLGRARELEGDSRRRLGASPLVPEGVAAEEDERQRNRGGEQEHRPLLHDSPALSDGHLQVRPRLELRGQLRRRAGLAKQLVHMLQPLPLRAGRVGAYQLVQGRLPVPRTSPSSADASRARPLRVRVFTVPRGRWRYSATSLCDM